MKSSYSRIIGLDVVIILSATLGLSACSVTEGNKVSGNEVDVSIDGTTTRYGGGHVVNGTGQDITVEINGSDVTVKCVGGEKVTIAGASGAASLMGSCGPVDITSAQQNITIVKAQQLSVLGACNTITSGTITGLRVLGSNNTITYHSLIGKPQQFGADNAVAQR